MAIWPFGRKGKRPRSQMKASDAADRRLSLEDSAERAKVGRKPSRKRSKREKHRSSPAPPRAGETAFAYDLDNRTSVSSIGQDNFAVARPTPMLQKRNSGNAKGNTLKKRLSKRSARELQREREIKALSSSPPSGHPRLANAWGYQSSDVRRGPSVNSRYGDHHTSNQSLPMGSQSSLSDSSDLYTYKVNAFAVFTPRPVIRYSENHIKHLPPRSTNPSSNSMRKDANLGDEDDLNSHKRVAELADDMDASALREMLERDRRRREKKRLEEQERRQRRLQRRLEREQQQRHESEHAEVGNKVEEIDIDELRGRDKTPSPATSSRQIRPESTVDEEHELREKDFLPEQEGGSWLRGPSNNSQQRDKRFSDISAHVIGNIDDRSLRAGKQGHDVNATSEEDVSRHRSPLFQAVANSSSIHMSSIAQESISDISRTENSEKRLSDTSSRRMSSWIAFFRRNSLRKRRSRDAPPSEFSNTSRDSFMKAQSHGAGPSSMPIPIPDRNVRRAGTVYRAQSKFVEHLDNYPPSASDSRVQSPLPVPLETVPDTPVVANLNSTEPSPRQSYTEGDDDDNYENDVERSRPMSWDEKSGMQAQSLASIDSEGSWMSGSYLRRISQKNPNFTSWRNSNGMNKLDKYDEAEENEDDVANDEYLNRLAEDAPETTSNSVSGLRRASSTAIGLDIAEAESDDGSRRSSNMGDMETWHQGIERKPTVVRRESGRARAMSKEVIFGDADMLDTDSMMDEDNASPVSPVSQEAEINRATSVDYGRGHKHARQISAGSAKLLDIRSHASIDSSRQ
ncbi:conserved hypothetical protein [Talaromyces stipitatus ATCC 10500]|uniref:Uncharacterized protein n=1 Tax=Talaromyces stipitatus (strain ATCC 10500 / CBS 375.48 / QM 6759 / NRRL 1006) TaxID=441959 RepID=B8LTE0_TALSN|nr:uncharacterized protein TSTA_064810 [Talaromyces stipitatus ATCC 10500]EED23018.1 conserved hypothetical protein [Talaromyces stipitatus ATCC 10500]